MFRIVSGSIKAVTQAIKSPRSIKRAFMKPVVIGAAAVLVASGATAGVLATSDSNTARPEANGSVAASASAAAPTLSVAGTSAGATPSTATDPRVTPSTANRDLTPARTVQPAPAHTSAVTVPPAQPAHTAPKVAPVQPLVSKPTTKAPAKPAAPVNRPGGRPGPSNTGVPAGTSLTVVNGDVVVTANGTVINGQDIKGALIIKASNVTVRNSLIEGSANSDSVVVSSGTGILLEDDEVAVAHPVVSHDAMSVKNATLNRLNIHGGVDGMKLSSNSVVENSWIHSLNSFSSDPAQGGRATHNDAIQIMSGTNIRITGNYLQAATSNNSAIQVTQDAGTVSGLYVENNWADGGGCTFNFSGHGAGGALLHMGGITVSGNRFGHTSGFSGCAILTDLQTTISQSGNVYTDGTPIKLQRHN